MDARPEVDASSARGVAPAAAIAAATAAAIGLAWPTGCSGVDEYVPPVIDAAVDAASPDAAPDAPVDGPVDDGGGDGNTGLPDLVPVEELMRPTIRIQDQSFTPGSCEVYEGCVGGAGLRRLLRFATVTANLGEADLYLGPPSDSDPRFEYSPCHGHYHLLGYAEYQLVDGDGLVVTGHKQAFCLMDSFVVVPGSTGRSYGCSNQGISVGWADSYAESLPCQWIDVTDVAPGAYTLRVVINPLGVLDESDTTNDVFEMAVVL